MAPGATGAYRFGDLLALARRSWIRRMADGVAQRGFPDYRATDAATMRLLGRAPVPVGRLGAVLGVTRQAARKVAAQLERRGYATTAADPHDRRKRNVVLTPTGRAYAQAVAEVVSALNRDVQARVDPRDLAGADRVLRAVMVGDEELALGAARLAPAPPPPGDDRRTGLP